MVKVIYDKILDELREDTSAGSSSSVLQVTDVAVEAGVIVGDAVYITDTNKVDKASASSIATSKCIGFVQEFDVDGLATITLAGPANIVVGLQSGDRYFLSETPGQITQTPPTTSGSVIVHVGDAIEPHKLVVGLSRTYTIRA